MAEYIEREYVLKCMEDSYKSAGISAEAKAKMTRWLNKAPAADVRPVVFCKDCMHSVQGKQSLECEKHRYVWNNMNRWVNDEDFCSWGVKREES